MKTNDINRLIMHMTNTNNPIDFPDPLDDLLYRSGLTAQGGWDELDSYQQSCIRLLVELVAVDCVDRLAKLRLECQTQPERNVEFETITRCIETIQDQYYAPGY